MRDQFERNINYMRVSVTDRCNLRCVYCMPKRTWDFQDQADRRRTAGAKGD